MAIKVSAYPSITTNRNVNLGSAFARTRLVGMPGLAPIAHSYIDAAQSRLGKSEDCTWRVREVRVRVMMDIDFNTAKIERGYFAPDDGNPHGYEADAPRAPDHFKLDEANVRVHEESHANDIVEAVEAEVRAQLNRPGVEEQLTITAPCGDDWGAYAQLHRLVRQRVRAIGTEAFERLLRDYQRHDTGSATERKARQAQVAEHANRD